MSALIECPHWGGEGGEFDYWKEWSDCFRGRVSEDRLAAFNLEIDMLDAEAEREMQKDEPTR